MKTRGNKKREEDKKKFRLAIVVVSIATVIAIILASTIGSQKFGFFHSLALDMLGPFQKGINSITLKIQQTKQNYFGLLKVREENIKLWLELREARRASHLNREALATNARLKKLLDLRDFTNIPSVSANITGKDPSLWFRTVIIDRGSNDNVKKGMPVVTADGIVGQILEVAANHSKVLLTIDPSSAIDVLVQKSRARGILKGTGSIVHSLEYILKNADINEGDYIVTAGYGGIFPPGMPVGQVTKITKKQRGMFHEIEVTSTVDFHTLEQVLVLLQPQPFPENP
ncbi:MAG: rod shape-determining protein MreC [Desulfobulbaceae bacterium]|nr:rod shape-determining protein MreC [Desulfobulbaceae bacterium]